MADYIVIPGKVNIYVAAPFSIVIDTVTYDAGYLFKLGESADEIRIRPQMFTNPVPGDRNGGRSGDPIEEQYLGESASVSLELSRFDTIVAAALQTSGGILTTPGTIPDTAVGALMRRDHSYRFLFHSTVLATRSKNFPCAIVKQPHILAGGTKFEMFQAEISFHRAPEGHWLDDPDGIRTENILYNSYIADIPS
jgi:hypothetical protein